MCSFITVTHAYIPQCNMLLHHSSMCCILLFALQNGCTPLYVASQEGHTEIVDILLKSGADPNLACTVRVQACDSISIASVYTPTSHITKKAVRTCYCILVYRIAFTAMCKFSCKFRTQLQRAHSTSTNFSFVVRKRVTTRAVTSNTRAVVSPHFFCFVLKVPPCSVPLGVATLNGHMHAVKRLLLGGANINRQDKVS